MSNLERKTPRGGARTSTGSILKVDYHTGRVKKLIESYGSRWDWYNGLVCPCSAQSQEVDRKFTKLTCSLCNATGWTYLFNKEIRMVPSSVRREEATLTYRVSQPGLMSNIYINLTCLPDDKVNIRDRIVFKESVTFRSESKIFNAVKTTYKFTFPIIELLRVLDDEGKVYDSTNFFPEKRDVDVTTDGLLYWVDGNNRPLENHGFSVLYSFFPSYIVITAAHEIRGTTAGKPPPEGESAWEDLPRSFTAKLEIPSKYLFGE